MSFTISCLLFVLNIYSYVLYNITRNKSNRIVICCDFFHQAGKLVVFEIIYMQRRSDDEGIRYVVISRGPQLTYCVIKSVSFVIARTA